jgi:murein L,D-transpeptidase YcbB/YkuD
MEVRCLIFVVMVFSAFACSSGEPSSPREPPAQNDAFRPAVAAAVAASDTPGQLPTAEANQLKALYPPQADAPLWVDAEGRPTADAEEALAMLRNATAEGLDPADYRVATLDQLATGLRAQRPPPAGDVAAFDTGLSASVLRYFRHLHSGRVDPRAAGFRMSTPVDEHDFAALLRTAVASHAVARTAADLTPPLALYRALRDMLTKYRSLAADPAVDRLPSSTASVRPGEIYPDLLVLRDRLIALGDLPGDMPAPPEPLVYQGASVDAVKRFQLRHGLEADGVIGKGTHAALGVPVAARVRQIELALERLRWLPHLGNRRFVAVNIPMFRLWAWDSIPPDGASLFSMGVIVGRALDTQTPVFVEELRHLIFRPYWNIPPSILRNEILPALDLNPKYLEQQDMEIVSGPGDDARPVPATAENIARLREGGLRLRQRPGPRNALGLVKFVFPNDENIYMHATPAPQLFSRSRRDFSHGCIRLEDPVALAEWALKGQPEWTRDRILTAMQGNQPMDVELAEPIQVILFYITAVVMPEDGTVHFAQDIYGHDARLERALKSVLVRRG